MYRLALGHERMLTLIKITLQFPAVMYSLIGSAFSISDMWKESRKSTDSSNNDNHDL